LADSIVTLLIGHHAVAMLASTIGGYIAGRLRTKWVDVHAHEVFFRDTAHGFLACGFATVVSAAFLAAAASNIAGFGSAGLAPASGGNDCVGQRPKGSRKIVSVAHRLAADRCLCREPCGH
jgi:hypothetical protein